MRRTGIALSVGRVSMPDDGEPALAIVTDYHPSAEGCFYLHPDSVPPIEGAPITYGDQHAWYEVDGKKIESHKLGYNFAVGAPLR